MKQRGQVTVLLAMTMVATLLLAGLAVDGGYGFLQWRQAQNAADLGSEAGVQLLEPLCAGLGSVDNQQVSAAIADVVATDAPRATGSWSGTYLDDAGAAIQGSPVLPSASGSAPTGACGVRVQVTPTWRPFLVELMGYNQLSATAGAAAVVGNNPTQTQANTTAGIVALATSGKHTIWGGGSGQFIVNGDILANSAGVTGTNDYADVVDNFGTSSTIIHGQIQSVAPYPLDPCFYPAGPTSATCAQHTSGEIEYDGGIVGGVPVQPDPLTYIPTPTSGDAACTPGGQPAVFGTSPSSGTLTPGVYENPVYITGSATFADCGGRPGVYIFAGGLAVCPASGDTVTGSDVMLYSEAHIKVATCGSGEGAKADGIHLGGQGTITLSGTTSGTFDHMLLYQDRAVPENVGLDDQTGDAATINLTGAIYDNSGGGAGILVAGGMPGKNGGDGAGNIAIDGIVVVDMFDTGGTVNIVITYNAAMVPGIGPVLTQ